MKINKGFTFLQGLITLIILLLAAIFLVLCAPGYGQDRHPKEYGKLPYKILLTSDIVLTTGDLITSQVNQAHGAHEVWMPYWYGRKPSAGRMALQMYGETLVLESLSHAFDKAGHHRIARSLQVARISVESVAVINNLSWMEKH